VHIKVYFAEMRITPEQRRLVLGRKSITGSLSPVAECFDACASAACTSPTAAAMPEASKACAD
jgi:hypothetical protein